MHIHMDTREMHMHVRRGASPVLSFEELSRILAQEWDGLSEVAKTPYNDMAAIQRGRYEAMSAALVLTQVGVCSNPCAASAYDICL